LARRSSPATPTEPPGRATESSAAATLRRYRDPDEAFTVGLLHDIGHFLMLACNTAGLARLDETSWDTPAALIDAERSICGFTHAEIGALACRQWGLPEVIEDAVATHHGPTTSDGDPHIGELAELIRFADHIMFPSAA
jgi:HD-like signal output (HDOD) protein